MHSSKNTNAGFTLIELLTVIAIIGILAAIMIPTVGKVRESARATQCVSNLRQVVVAFNLFAQDNRGFFPTVANDDWVKPDVGIYNYLQKTSSTAYWDTNNPAGYSQRFKGTPLSCPTQAAKFPTKWSYGMSEVLTWSATGKRTANNEPYPDTSRITQPSLAAVVIETDGALRIKIPGTGSGKEPERSPRHGDRIHVGYVDTHVGKIKHSDIPISETDPFWARDGN